MTGLAAKFLENELLNSFMSDEDHPLEETPGHENASHSAASSSSIVTSSAGAASSLIPCLPDVMVRDRIWAFLINSPSILLLLHLSQVNSSWRRFVERTPEWSSLVCVFLDSTGYLSSVTRHGLVRLPLAQRFSMELANYRSLIAEDMRDVEARVRFSRLQASGFPFYISIGECPPSVDECPEYYDL